MCRIARLLASTAGIIAAILLAIFAPKNAFLMLYGTAVAGMLFVWLVILNTHLRFRRAISRERLLSLPMRLRAHPFFTVLGIVLLLAISVTTFFVDGLQWSVPAFSVFLCGNFHLVSAFAAARPYIKETTHGAAPYCMRSTLCFVPDSKATCCVPSDIEYDHARAIWNGMFARTPALIARCANVADVQSAVRAAAETGIITAVRCGGHSLAGFSTCDDGLVIDLSPMRHIDVDPQSQRARFSGGCLLGSVDTATQKAGLVFPSGVVSHTGAAGLVLGGGTGWLTRRFGLSCDNVEGFTLVTADSSIVRATALENPDLFWALRGGGGNFGIVTEFQVKLHPLTSVVLGEGLTPEHDIGPLLEYLARLYGGRAL